MLKVNTPCTNGCHCAGRPFSPVCDESTGISYYSPCHAGCPVVLDSKNKVSSSRTSLIYLPWWKLSFILSRLNTIPTVLALSVETGSFQTQYTCLLLTSMRMLFHTYLKKKSIICQLTSNYKIELRQSVEGTVSLEDVRVFGLTYDATSHFIALWF